MIQQKKIDKKSTLLKWLKCPWLYIILLLSVSRIILGNLVGLSLASIQGLDDGLLINYASLAWHFTSPDRFSLVKFMSYPLLLNINYLLNIKFYVLISLLWIIDALMIFYLTYKLSKNKILSLIFFIIVLFTPCAFDYQCGTRLYRNAIIAPFVLMVFETMLVLFVWYKKSTKNYKMILLTILFGLVFTFTYYIKEDGIWLLLSVAFCLAVALIYFLVCCIKKKIILKRFFLIATLCILPIVIFICCTHIYKSINNHFFQVYETQTRTEGQFGSFCSNIYKIDSPNRTYQHWAPADAIEKAFSVSPTLQKYPKLKEAIFKTPLCKGDIVANPIGGDFLTWVLRDALVTAEVWQNERQISDLFVQVNTEIKKAFDTGLLQRDKKFQIVSATGGYSFQEIMEVALYSLYSIKSSLFLENYMPGVSASNTNDKLVTNTASRLTHINFYDETKSNDETIKINRVLAVIFDIYRCVNVLFIIILISNFVLCMCNIFLKRYRNGLNIRSFLLKNKKIYLYFILSLFFVGLAYCYGFGINWFAAFIFSSAPEIYDAFCNFYSIALVPLLFFVFYFSCLSLFCRFCNAGKYKQEFKVRRNDS